MSYASVAATNAPPPEDQPRPDPALLNTTPPHHSLIIDDTSKVTLVPPEFKEHMQSPAVSPPHNPPNDCPKSEKSQPHTKTENPTFLDLTKHYLIRPGVAGGLIGLVNIGLLASVGRAFYLRPQLRRDTTAISSAIAATIALVSAEGCAAEKYRQTPRGEAEERRAEKEGALIFRHLHEQVMRPGMLGGMVGLVNAVVLGALGYISYQNWSTTWDKRTVSAISLGLLTLWGGEGFIGEKYLANSNT